MVILGIDPGYAIVGYGCVRYEHGRFSPLACGVLRTAAGTPFSARLRTLYEDMERLLTEQRPDAVAMEKLYFKTNQKTGIDVAQARGVLLLAAELQHIPVTEYTPLQVKSAVTGYGQATKAQVMEMTRRLLRLEEVLKPDDAADAMAMAICHAQRGGLR